VYSNPELVEGFQQLDWLVCFDRLQGYDDRVALKFAHSFQNVIKLDYIIFVRGMEIQVNEVVTNRVSFLPMGLLWYKEDTKISIDAKMLFF
jgi:hypothetical protein